MDLKIVGMICATILACIILLTNQNDENAVVGVIVFYLMALAIIFIDWEPVINKLLH